MKKKKGRIARNIEKQSSKKSTLIFEEEILLSEISYNVDSIDPDIYYLLNISFYCFSESSLHSIYVGIF